MRSLVTVIAIALAAGRADAKAMVHLDLTGLVLGSEAIVIAEKIGPAPTEERTRYRVTRVVRGGHWKVGTYVDVFDDHYDTFQRPIAAEAVLFLGLSKGQPYLLPSGLRVIERGKVFRFEQHENPGPYRMVPQHAESDRGWQTDEEQLDLAGLERAIATATQRVRALDLALAERDPVRRRASLLALLPPPDKDGDSFGFYRDDLAARVRSVLDEAGDLEGALLVDARDQSGWMRSDVGTPSVLIAIARDRSKDRVLRVAAIFALARHREYHDDAAHMRAAIALVDDPLPDVRIAAIQAAANPARVTSSDRAQQRVLDTVTEEARAAIAKRYARETDREVLSKIVKTFKDTFEKPLPARR